MVRGVEEEGERKDEEMVEEKKLLCESEFVRSRCVP